MALKTEAAGTLGLTWRTTGSRAGTGPAALKPDPGSDPGSALAQDACEVVHVPFSVPHCSCLEMRITGGCYENKMS